MSHLESERFTRLVRGIVDRSLLWAFAILLIAACVMGWQHGAIDGWLWGMFAVGVILLEVGAIHKLFEARAAKEYHIVVAACALWVCAFGYSMVQSLAVASTNQSEVALMRVDAVDTKADAAKSIKDAEAKRTLAEQQVAHVRSLLFKPVPQVNGIEIKTVDQADAIVANLRGDRIFARSKSCNDVSRPDSRTHCDKITAALAAKDDVAERRKLQGEAKAADTALAAAERELADAVMKNQKIRTVKATTGFQETAGRWLNIKPEAVSDAIATQRTVTLNIALTLAALLLFGGVVSRKPEEPASPNVARETVNTTETIKPSPREHITLGDAAAILNGMRAT